MSSCVHYKFANVKDYSTIAFDGLAISLADLRDAVLVQKKMAKSPTFILEVVNAQTKEEYKGESSQTHIPRNASVLVRRVPVKSNKKVLDTTVVTGKADSPDPAPSHTAAKLAKSVNLAKTDASEEAKLAAVMQQGTDDFKPSNLPRLQSGRGRGRPVHHHEPVETGPLPSNYVCFRCGEKGHHIRNCPNPKSDVPIHAHGSRNRHGTGIPSEFLAPATDPNAPGVFRDRNGKLVVPIIDRDAYQKGKQLTKNDFPEGADVPDAPTLPVKEARIVPEELRCPLCKEIMKDATLIPCCGLSFCDECIRECLMKSNFLCPDCKELNSPDKLSPNASVRVSVNKFLNSNLVDQPPTPVLSQAKPLKIELRLKTSAPSAPAKAEAATTATTSSTTTTSGTEVRGERADEEKKSAAAEPSEKKAVNGRADPSSGAGTPRRDYEDSKRAGGDRERKKEVSPSSSRGSSQSRRSATPSRGSDSEADERRRRIAEELEQTYKRVVAGVPVPGVGPAGSALLPGFAPQVPPLFAATGALFPRTAADAPLLSKEDFYRLRQKLKTGKRRSGSRSPSRSRSGSRSPSRSRSVSRSRSPSRSPSRSRSPVRYRRPYPRSHSPPPLARPRSPTPPPPPVRSDRYGDRGSRYERPSRYDEHYRGRRSRSPPPAPSASDYEAYRAWYDYHRGRGRQPYSSGPPPADWRYRESHHRDERYRDERHHDDRHRERDRDLHRRRSRSPPPRQTPPGYREWYEKHHASRQSEKYERDHRAEESRTSSQESKHRSSRPEADHRSSQPEEEHRPSKRERVPSPAPVTAPSPKKKRGGRTVELVTVPAASVGRKDEGKKASSRTGDEHLHSHNGNGAERNILAIKVDNSANAGESAEKERRRVERDARRRSKDGRKEKKHKKHKKHRRHEKVDNAEEEEDEDDAETAHSDREEAPKGKEVVVISEEGSQLAEEEEDRVESNPLNEKGQRRVEKEAKRRERSEKKHKKHRKHHRHEREKA